MRKSGKLTKHERRVLEHCSDGPAERPNGVPKLTLFNLITHRWLIRVEREVDFGPELYLTTPDGRAALANDDNEISN